MTGILCAVLAICGAAVSAADRLPTWSETAAHAIPIVQRWEGLPRQHACDASPSGVCVRAYLDTIADPDVPTIGYGQTRHFDDAGNARPVRMGDVITIEDAEANLRRDLRRAYWAPYRACVTVTGLAPETDAAFTSLTWNIGTGGVCRSTALRRLNAGDVAGACEALTWWNRAGGRVVRGLTNRRSDERGLCMAGAS